MPPPRKLPLLLALPHAGLEVPPEVREICLLGPEAFVADSDEDAAEIYALDDGVAALVRCPVVRSIVDVNRAEDDLGEDGAIKTVTRRASWGSRPISRGWVRPDTPARRLARALAAKKTGMSPYGGIVASPPSAG